MPLQQDHQNETLPSVWDGINLSGALPMPTGIPSCHHGVIWLLSVERTTQTSYGVFLHKLAFFWRLLEAPEQKFSLSLQRLNYQRKILACMSRGYLNDQLGNAYGICQAYRCRNAVSMLRSCILGLYKGTTGFCGIPPAACMMTRPLRWPQYRWSEEVVRS